MKDSNVVFASAQERNPAKVEVTAIQVKKEPRVSLQISKPRRKSGLFGFWRLEIFVSDIWRSFGFLARSDLCLLSSNGMRDSDVILRQRKSETLPRLRSRLFG